MGGPCRQHPPRVLFEKVLYSAWEALSRHEERGMLLSSLDERKRECSRFPDFSSGHLLLYKLDYDHKALQNGIKFV